MLILHIIIASLLTISATGLLVAALKRYNRPQLRILSIVGLVMTFITGVSLVVSYGGIGRFCASMTIATVSVIAIERFYIYRLASVSVRVDN